MRFSNIAQQLLRCAFFLFFAIPLTAQATSSLATKKPENRIPGPMVLPQAWPGGETLPAHLAAIMNHVSLASYKPYKHSSPHTMRISDGPAKGTKVGPKSANQFVNVFKTRYGITDYLEIRTATPYISLNIKNHSANHNWKGGLGDTTMMLRYGIKKRTEGSPFSVAVDLGTTLPTGDTGNKDKDLATNAFSLIMGGGISWIDHNQRVDFDGRYAAYTEGAHNIKPGDFALFHGHYAYAVSNNFDVGIEGYYRNEQASKVDNKSQSNAFSEAYLGPKIQIKVPEMAYLMVGAAVLFPVYRNYNSLKLSTDTRYEFSALIAF